MADADTPGDVNAVIAGLLRDLGAVQAVRPKRFAYRRAAAAVQSLEQSIGALVDANGALPKIPGIGPASARVIREVLETGGSATVEAAIDAAGDHAEIVRQRSLRQGFLSRAEVVRILGDAGLPGPALADHRGDFQMHSEFSDGSATVAELAAACVARGYRVAAITDHSHGLTIAGGMTMAEAAEQRRAIDRVNAEYGATFRLLQGVEANIDADGRLDLTDDEAAQFELVLAAPHSRLRRAEDQTTRMVTAVRHPHVRILAHPRGRMAGVRGGVVADWRQVFETAARHGVAIELDGDPARQDLDAGLAALALEAGCLFAVDSDAHSPEQLSYAETALAHARLASIPADRIVNCWPLDRLLDWLARPAR